MGSFSAPDHRQSNLTMAIRSALNRTAFLQSVVVPVRHNAPAVDRAMSSSSLSTHQSAMTPIASGTPRRMPAIIRPVVLAPPLLQFLEDGVYQRSNVVKALGEYVREHNLQDPNNRSVVKCDEKLKNLFGVDQCTMQEISRYISPHLLKPETVGGKYLAEAKQIEDDYLREKDKEIPSGGKKKKHRRASRDDDPRTRHLLKPVILSEELTAICRKKEMTRPRIVKAIWDYIRLNNLKGDPGKPIRCDLLLQKVFKSDTIEDVRFIMKGIEAHVSKKD